jgi:hypothetical protein
MPYPFNRGFSSVEPAQLLEALKNWYAESRKSGGRLLNIDEETILGKRSPWPSITSIMVSFDL